MLKHQLIHTGQDQDWRSTRDIFVMNAEPIPFVLKENRSVKTYQDATLEPTSCRLSWAPHRWQFVQHWALHNDTSCLNWTGQMLLDQQINGVELAMKQRPHYTPFPSNSSVLLRCPWHWLAKTGWVTCRKYSWWALLRICHILNEEIQVAQTEQCW